MTGDFTFCGREFHWKHFFWEEHGGYVEVPPQLYTIDEFFAKFGITQA